VRVLPRYPGTLLLALVLASLVWYVNALDRRERISERQLDASLTLVNVPANLAVTTDVPRSLTLRLRGPLNRLRALDPASTGVVIDLRGVSEGDREFAVEARDVIVPAGVSVVAVSPSQIALRLEALVQRRLPVRIKVSGEPASGFEVHASRAEPDLVEVIGPRQQLERLGALSTEPVAVDGLEGAVEAVVAIRSPLPLVRIIQPLTVRAVVEIGERKIVIRRGTRH